MVVGKPLGEGERVILHPSSFDAVHVEMEHQVGPGLALDTDRHTVILTNQLGNGVSFSPSTHPHARYPAVTIADNVRAQRALLDALGVRELDLIYGYSMGALQAFEWAVAYPDAVARVVAVCGAAAVQPGGDSSNVRGVSARVVGRVPAESGGVRWVWRRRVGAAGGRGEDDHGVS